MMTNLPFKGATFLQHNENKQSKVGIVFFHAYTGSPIDLNLQARILQRLGYDVLSILFEGHKSPDFETLFKISPDRWWQQAKDAIHWMKDLGYEQLFVFGLSLGGIVAMRAVTDDSLPVDAGGAFNSPVVSQTDLDLSRALYPYLKRVMLQHYDENYFNENVDRLLSLHREQMQALDEWKRGYVPQLSQSKRPILVVQSGNDELIPAKEVYDTLQELHQAELTFHWFPNNTHVITVDRNRKPFEKALVSFIKDHTESLE